MLSEKAIYSSVDNTSPNPAYESSTMCPQDDDGTDVIYEHIGKQIQFGGLSTSYIMLVCSSISIL